MKKPGTGFDVKSVSMDFTYDKLGDVSIGDAYARLLKLYTRRSNILARSDAVESSWRFLPLLDY